MDCRTQLASLASEEADKGDFLMATKILTTNIKLEPTNHYYYYERSICHHKLGNYQASLDDANSAIRLNSEDHNIHYQKGLALLGLKMFPEAVTSFKKAIELRARQGETKLSDIFKILQHAIKELTTARERLAGEILNNHNSSETVTIPLNQISANDQRTSNNPVDSTTDRHQPGTSTKCQEATCESHTEGGSNSSGSRGGIKRAPDNEPQTYQQNKAESDVDVDDTNNQPIIVASNPNDRTPSSSMSATSKGPSSATPDSYSSKYKRLKRDRERARRGTLKQCTIKPSELEELEKSNKSMRVIAPIDGWLYSGVLSTSSKANGKPQYVVKLDGDSTGSGYLFDTETVLKDVIKEERVESVSSLKKGSRICCYWSRQYKCLSTGVVTSRTFEPTKSLVSVKYDNGDLSALPLEDLRHLPPDYPKYMSNCDPLLLARGGSVNQIGNRIIVECKPPPVSPLDHAKEEKGDTEEIKPEIARDKEAVDTEIEGHNVNGDEARDEEDEDDEDATIPPTDETIDFITSETTLEHNEGNQNELIDCVERVSNTKDNIAETNETQSNAITSRASSEENDYGILYRPWIFDGRPIRTKKNNRVRDNYSMIRRGNEVIKIGDSAELMPRDESILPFVAKIDGFWATSRGEMKVKVRWYYRLAETEGVPYELKDGENALFETDHKDENDVQSIYRATKILSWSDYSKNNLGHVNSNNDNTPKIFYLAGYYNPVRRVKHLNSDVVYSALQTE